MIQKPEKEQNYFAKESLDLHFVKEKSNNIPAESLKKYYNIDPKSISLLFYSSLFFNYSAGILFDFSLTKWRSRLSLAK